MSVAHILSVKGRDVFTVRPKESVDKIVHLLAEKRIGAVIVTDTHGHISGIISERDIVRHMSTDGAALMSKTADAIMTKKVNYKIAIIVCHNSLKFEECFATKHTLLF